MVFSHSIFKSLALAGMLLFVSCKKNTEIPDPYCVAGNEGTITLLLFPEHHEDPITSLPNYLDTAFIKFNTDEYPGSDDPELYDLIVTGIPGSNDVVINNLSCGTYFIYMTGFDQSSAERVKGGIPVRVEYGETIKSVIIPVTED